MKVIITPSKTNREEPEFPSLRCALEWAKNNNMTELHLIKIVIKEPLDKYKMSCGSFSQEMSRFCFHRLDYKKSLVIL